MFQWPFTCSGRRRSWVFAYSSFVHDRRARSVPRRAVTGVTLFSLGEQRRLVQQAAKRARRTRWRWGRCRSVFRRGAALSCSPSSAPKPVVFSAFARRGVARSPHPRRHVATASGHPRKRHTVVAEARALVRPPGRPGQPGACTCSRPPGQRQTDSQPHGRLCFLVPRGAHGAAAEGVRAEVAVRARRGVAARRMAWKPPRELLRAADCCWLLRPRRHLPEPGERRRRREQIAGDEAATISSR